MTDLSRKQREIQERKTAILEIARSKLAEQGYHKLRISDISDELKVSRGTIFNDFPTKEDIILALSIESMERRTALFRRAATFSGRPRERLMAVGYACEVFFRLHPEHFAIEHLIRSASFWEKTTSENQQVFRGCETQCVGIVSGIVVDAIAQRDLTLPDSVSPEDLVFAMWSMTYGACSLLSSGQEALRTIGIHEPFSVIRENHFRLLDGYNWSPLTSEHDYNAVLTRIQTEVFADEQRRIAGR